MTANDRQTETGAGETSKKPGGCDNQNQSSPVGTVPGSGETVEQGPLGFDRTVGEGFFAGGGTLDEAILIQLWEVADKGLRNAEACLDWYNQEKQEFQNQKEKLEQLIVKAREQRNQSKFEEE
ncbi:hypothetical protein ACL6C3_16810 [Capilliphycus salinus ALCB114379]|uniref:hypothetical protein n=1 Tax=Capilliphycus salinus TaxID=2768948 RepID=UPI0039A77898